MVTRRRLRSFLTAIGLYVGAALLIGYFGINSIEGYARYEETLDIVLKGLTSDSLSHRGQYYQFHDVPMVLKPLQTPYPPLWAGAGSPSSLDFCAERGAHVVALGPNVAVKATALPCYSAEPYPFTRVQAYARKAYEAFGGKRTFWGSDLSRSPVPYREQIDMWLKDAPWLKAEDKEWVMGRGICEWLGWKIP